MSGANKVTDRLTITYSVALLLIAVLSVSLHLLLERVIRQHHGSGTIINVAGRQRMLSQRTALLALRLQHGEESARRPLRQTLALMEDSHDALVEGGAMGIEHGLSAAGRRMYHQGVRPLEVRTGDYLSRFSRIADAADPAAVPVVPQSASDEMLAALDAAVTLFEDEGRGRIEHLENAQTLVTAILLLTLAVEALFVFRPMIARLRVHVVRLAELASTDTLTGLPNRRVFLERARTELALARRSGRPLSLLMLDIDHFKRVNDEHGHDVGDRALRLFAATTTGVVRQTDALGRLGGEEFGVLLPDTLADGAELVAEKLRAAVASARGEGVPPLTVSIGLAQLHRSDRELDNLLRRADAALYAAKDGGRDRVATAPVPADVPPDPPPHADRRPLKPAPALASATRTA